MRNKLSVHLPVPAGILRLTGYVHGKLHLKRWLYLPLFILILAILSSSLTAQVKRVTLLNTTDEHSTLLPLPLVDYHPELANPSVGGFPRLATLVRSIREDAGNDPVLLMSAGDFVGGTPYAWLILEGYSAEIEIMKRIGYDALTIGNHEFDYGPGKIAGYFMNAGYPGYNDTMPLVSSNLVIPEGNPLMEVGIRGHHIFDLPNGLRIGVFGLLGREAYSVASYIEPVTVTDQHEAASRQVGLLREKGADIIVALTHSGVGEDRELAAAVDGIDVILGGHTHQLTHEPVRVNNTVILHPGYYLSNLGRLDLEWDPQTGALSVVNERNNNPFLIPLDSSVPEDPEILALIDGYTDKLNLFVSEHTEGMFAEVEDPVFSSDFSMISPGPFRETTVGNFVTDAMRKEVARLTGHRVDFAVQANGVVRADIVPGTMDWSRDQVSFFDLVTVSGLGSGLDGKAGYPLVSFWLTGREILSVLEITSLLSQLMGDMYFLQVSGLRYTYDPGKAIWLRIPFAGIPVPAYRSVVSAEMYAGEGIQDDGNYVPVEEDRLYHVVTDHYLTSFLPMVGDILPRLGLVLKDEHGNTLTPDETILVLDGKEFKVWEALARYGASFEQGEEGLPLVPAYYAETGGRITSREFVPLAVWAWTVIIIVLLIISLLVRLAVIKIRARIRRRKN